MGNSSVFPNIRCQRRKRRTSDRFHVRLSSLPRHSAEVQLLGQRRDADAYGRGLRSGRRRVILPELEDLRTHRWPRREGRGWPTAAVGG